MNKTVILICASLGGIVGAYVPYVFGDHDLMGGWSILMSFVGGIAGIWLGVVISKRMG